MADKPVDPTPEERFPVHNEDSFIQGVLQRNSNFKVPPVAEKEPKAVEPSAKPTDVKEPEVKPVATEPAKEQPKGQDQPDPVQLVSDDDLLYLADKGLTDTDLEGKSIEEVAELVKTHKAQDNPTEGQQQPSPTVMVTQEMADKIGGIAKSFVGKSTEDLLIAMQNQQAYISKLEAEKNKQPNLETKDKDAIQKELNDIDLFDADPEEQTKKIAEIVTRVTGNKNKGEVAEVVKQVIREIIPNIEEVAQVAKERTTTAFLEEIKKGMPEGYDPHEEITRFKAERNLSDKEIKFYMDYPERLIKDVQDYTQSKDVKRKYNELVKSKEKEIKLQSFKRFRSAMLRSADSPVNASDVNVAPRTQAKDGSDWTVQRIRERHSKK